ncbi:diacylglycerol kinase [Wenjunlia vitaminophila]|uniref:Diacylglycerol kinase n=1 Tax=Wenjunlia vitaminophila TaxID=76728 RepID=A0A0T6LMC4_WENVI|nr:diacylglycerol kinase family protein [Wenjunlia vitaminophila]KRV47141.1 diacylglycerol kinase [Wenjunlia vitaminophila]
MRALLVVNPAATTTSARTRDVLIHALASDLKLEVAATEYRGHARDLGRRAAESDDIELVVALGGDGTVNEVVNGLLHAGPAPDLPRLAVVPGGHTNVFARNLGLPNDAVEATGALLDALRTGSERSVGLGLATGVPGTSEASAADRWFTFCAGLGFDAAVVGRVEGKRAEGRRSTGPLYVRQVVRQFLGDPNRKDGLITLERPGEDPVSGLVVAIVSNTSPWTYLGNRPVWASPDASFDSDLDVMALTRLSPAAVARYGSQLLSSSGRGPRGKHVVSVHDASEFTLTAQTPLPFQVDGDHLGLRSNVRFTGVRQALRVIV